MRKSFIEIVKPYYKDLIGLLLMVGIVWLFFIIPLRKTTNNHTKIMDAPFTIKSKFQVGSSLYVVGCIITKECDTFYFTTQVPPQLYGICDPGAIVYLPIDSTDLPVIKRINERIIKYPL